jgi:hypothetical protein
MSEITDIFFYVSARPPLLLNNPTKNLYPKKEPENSYKNFKVL